MTETANLSRKAWVIRAVGIILYGLLVYGVLFFWDHWNDAQFGWIALFTFPVSIGVAAQIFLDPLVQRRFGWVLWSSVGCFSLLALGLILVAVETLICVAIASPMLFVGGLVGIAATRGILRALSKRFDTTTLNASLLILPVLLGIPNDLLRSQSGDYTVTSETIVDASPTDIWAHLLDIPQIQPDERIFTISHSILGAPRAMSAEMGPEVRMAYWEGGISFGERLTQTIHQRLVAWEFEFADNFAMLGFDDHIRPRGETLNVYGGRYTITPISDTQTTLSLSTDYSLNTPMNGYVALWGHRFLDDFHSSVLHVIKTRAEAP